MAPDLNSLPDNRSVRPVGNHSDAMTPLAGDSISPAPSPRSASISLQAAATLNAGLQRTEPNRRSSSSSVSRAVQQSSSPHHRRSQVLMNLHMNDPSMPGPGEMVSESSRGSPGSAFRTVSPLPFPGSPLLLSSPHHNRTPSLGELHQELENEQEFQVNRLLSEIRRLQLQVQQHAGQAGATTTTEAGSPTTTRAAMTAAATSGPPPPFMHSQPRSPVCAVPHPRTSFDLARAELHRRSRTPSRGASPRLRAASISAESMAGFGEQAIMGSRDESAFYQAEAQNLVRENQMLRHRIRDLERQLSEATGGCSNSSVTHEPSTVSNLTRSTSVSDEGATAAPLPTATDAPKPE